MSDHIHECLTNTNQNSNVNVYLARYCKPWTISSGGLSFIAVWESGILNGKYFDHQVTEGFILKAYLDNRGIPTIGCGHRILPGDNIKAGDTITLERARAFKKRAIAEVEQRLNTDIRVPLFQFEYDALCSISYNCGAYTGSDDLIRRINTGDYAKAFDYLLKYRVGTNHGVRNRRYREAKLFAAGVYDASH